MTDLKSICEKAQAAKTELNYLTEEKINAALKECAAAIKEHAEEIKAANLEDVKSAR